MSRILLEIACGSIEDALAAANGGADRLELCAALELDGLTPSIGFVAEVIERTPVPCVAMIRPRSGNFVYTSAELGAMERDVELVVEAGVEGVVFGCLTSGRGVAVDQTDRLIGAASGAETIFHRAFDQLAKPLEAIDVLADLGITRILTSGGAPTALEGVDAIAALVKKAAGKIQIIAGGGIREQNVEDIIRTTGCAQVHLSRR